MTAQDPWSIPADADAEDWLEQQAATSPTDLDPGTGLPFMVAFMRQKVLEARERDRVAWCQINGFDPGDEHPCHGCLDTGTHRNGFICWCAAGKRLLAKAERTVHEQTNTAWDHRDDPPTERAMH